MAEFELVRIPFGRWQPDAPKIADGGLDDVRNAIYHAGKWHRVRAPSIIEVGGSIGGMQRIVAGQTWSDENGQNRYAVGSYQSGGGHLYVGDLSTGDFTQRSKSGGYTGDSPWDVVKFGASVIFTNGSDPVQLLNFTANSGDLITSTTKPRGRYLAQCRGHVILLNITAPSTNHRQFYWSALNDAANWEPGSNRAGFSELPADAGVISGAVGFEDFFLIFTTSGVYRMDYIGGEQVWRAQQIGGWYDGLPRQFYRTIVPVGRDAYYLSRTGPRVVLNGEATKPLGMGQFHQHMVDTAVSELGGLNTDATIKYGDRAWGCHDGFREVIYWAWQLENSLDHPTETWRQVWVYAYSIPDDALSRFMPLEGAFDVDLGWAVDFAPVLTRPGTLEAFGSNVEIPWGVLMLRTEIVSLASDAQIYEFGPGSPYMDTLFRSKIWRPTASHTQLHAVRPLVTFEGRASSTNPVADPIVSVTIRPRGGSAVTLAQGSSAEDGRGFLHPPTPLSASEFSFDLQIVDAGGGTDPAFLRDLMGLELLVTADKSTKGGSG